MNEKMEPSLTWTIKYVPVSFDGLILDGTRKVILYVSLTLLLHFGRSKIGESFQGIPHVTNGNTSICKKAK